MKRTEAFKAQCLEIMDEVNAKHETYVITNCGIPITKMVPYDIDLQSMPSLFGVLVNQAIITNNILDPMVIEWDGAKFDDL